jgi:PKD repeat protein
MRLSLGAADHGHGANLPRWVSAANTKKPVAVPGAFPTLGQAPKKVKLFDNGSSSPNGPIVKWEWNFGDAPGGWHDYTATQGLAYHTYASPGTYQAHLRVSDSQSPPMVRRRSRLSRAAATPTP